MTQLAADVKTRDVTPASGSIIGPWVIVSRMHIVERLREWDFCTDSGAAALRAFHRQRPA
jgi:hypothetical protein